MEQPPLPPPPPPPRQKLLTGLHGPGTNFFPRIRSRLSALEYSSQLPEGKSPNSGLIVAFIFSALASMGLSFVVELVFLIGVGFAVTTAIFAPILEELFKALGVLVVVLFMWKMIPNRRYGAALGAAAGLGFGVSEFIIYVASSPTVETVLTRLIVIFMHPIWTAFVGMSFFVMFSRRPSPNRSSDNSATLFLLLSFLGVANHMVWNSIAIVLAFVGLPLYGLLLNIVFTLPLFLIVLRDLLGGHFNFQNFFETLTESTPNFTMIPPPPPPPP